MRLSKDAAAESLAMAHFDIEPGIQRISRVVGTPQEEADPDQPVKLLEANENTIASGILPIFFGPDAGDGIPYSSVIIEVTPDEYDQICSGELKLPNAWRLGHEIKRQPAVSAD